MLSSILLTCKYVPCSFEMIASQASVTISDIVVLPTRNR